MKNKRFSSLLVFLLFLMILPTTPSVKAHEGSEEHNGSAENILPVAKGVYRLPYPDGTKVKISRDYITHDAHNRFDMSAETGASIVAAADGIIAYVQDSFVITCPSSEWKGNCADYTGPAGEANCCIRGTPGCNCRNNYIWISHPNGEWTKYTHIQQNSVPFELVPGTPVTAGTILGKEGDVGAATPCDACTDGSHLHFEVARPDRVNTDLKPDNPNYDPLGIDPGNCGTCGIPSVSDEDKDDIVNNANRQNRIPNFCQTGFLKAGETYTATGCDGACINDSETQKGTVADDKIFYTQTTDLITNQSNVYTVNAGAGVAWRAGNRIRLTSGFTASDGSYFSASIGSCDSPAAP